MAIDRTLYRTPAIRGDITGPVINTIIALRAVAKTLEALAPPNPVDEKALAERAQFIAQQVALIHESIEKLDLAFDRLSGWTAD